MVSAYTVAAGLVNAAVRLGAVGAIEAQGALASTLCLIDTVSALAFDPAAPLAFASMTPLLDVASVRHARSSLRLFAS